MATKEELMKKYGLNKPKKKTVKKKAVPVEVGSSPKPTPPSIPNTLEAIRKRREEISKYKKGGVVRRKKTVKRKKKKAKKRK